MREYKISFENMTVKMQGEYKKQHGLDAETKSDKVKSFVRSNLIEINTFHDLIVEIAELSYKNPDVMLFFRGQTKNYINISTIDLKPSIYRKSVLGMQEKFEGLKYFSNKLIDKIEEANNSSRIELSKNEIEEISNIEILQHSILQHYEVWPTPFLDVSQSIKVACTFASLNNDGECGYIYVLALPYIKGRISVDSEEYITNIRLISIGSSYAKRPFFQEGYLVKTEYTKPGNRELRKFDFNRRLVAAYEFKNNEDFWGNERPINKAYIYPPKDTMKDICESLNLQFDTKQYLSMLEDNDKVREFLNMWNFFEKSIKVPQQTFLQGLKSKMKSDVMFERYYNDIDELRKFRNSLVHDTGSVSNLVLAEKTELLKSVLVDLNVKLKY